MRWYICQEGFQLKLGHALGLTVRPELVEGWAVKPFMVRQGSPEQRRRARHERLNRIRSRFKWKAALINNLLLFQSAVNIIDRLLVGIKTNIGQIGTRVDAQAQQSGVFDGQYQRAVLSFQHGRGMAVIK